MFITTFVLLAKDGALGLQEPDQALHRRASGRRSRQAATTTGAANATVNHQHQGATGPKQTFGAETLAANCKTTVLEEDQVNRHLIAWAKEFGLNVVTTAITSKGHSHAHDCDYKKVTMKQEDDVLQ